MYPLNIVLPKGRIFDEVAKLMSSAGYPVSLSGRGLRTKITNSEFFVKVMKPQNIPLLLALGKHDIGFSGYDWIYETATKEGIETIMDLGLNKVDIVAAIPQSMTQDFLTTHKIIVASEYKKISKEYLEKKGYNYRFISVHGATEVYPPEDADMIIDNCSTGTTLRENNLKIVDTILPSATCFIASKLSMKNPKKAEQIQKMKMLFESVLTARQKVMLEMNVELEKKDIIKKLPAMRCPTVAPLAQDKGFAVKIVVDKIDVSTLIPKLKKWGATDILEYQLNKVVK